MDCQASLSNALVPSKDVEMDCQAKVQSCSRTQKLEKGSCLHLRTARPPNSLYRRDSACAMADKPRFATFSAYSSTEPSGNLKRFWTTEVNSLILRPLVPKCEKVKQ